MRDSFLAHNGLKELTFTLTHIDNYYVMLQFKKIKSAMNTTAQCR